MGTIDNSARGFLEGASNIKRYLNIFSPSGSSGLISKMVPRKARVLDVGCGDGSLAEIIQEHCCADVFGIEPEITRVELARKRGIKVHHGFLDENSRRDFGEFEVVLFADVLEHVPNPFQLIEYALCCLARNGSIVISVPNAAHWSVRLMVLGGRFVYEECGIRDATHLRWFTRESLILFLRRAGLRVVEMKSSSGFSLEIYRRWPWLWLPSPIRWHLIVKLSKVWPTMFGCQYIVRAVRAEDQKKPSC